MNSNEQNSDIIFHQPKLARPLIEVIAFWLVLAQTFTLAIGLPNIITGSGGSHNLKIAVLALGAGLVGFGVLHVGVKYLAEYSARGFKLATAAAISGILVVGAGFALATFSGNALPDVADLELQSYASELSQEIGDINALSTEARNSGSTLGIVASDLRAWARCEERKNCLSDSEFTGRGSITIALEGLAERAESIQSEFDKGDAARATALEEINGKFEEFQEALGDTKISIWKRRNHLKQTDNILHQAVSELANAVPLHLIGQYADELATGISLPGRVDVATRINAILSGHSNSLKAILQSANGEVVGRPAFPIRPGVGDALRYIPTFAPLALLVLAIDLIFPISIWIMTHLKLVWEYEQEAARRSGQLQKATSGKQPHERSRHPSHGLPNGKSALSGNEAN